MRIQSPAKINLRLKVEGRRQDGYHFLSMLNIFCDLFDEINLEFTRESGIKLKVTPEGLLPETKKNFAYIAADMFYQRFQIQGGLSIEIAKQIPLGSGLGGGSSNAAFLLRALVEKFGIEILKKESITKEALLYELKLIATEIGSDVAFFLGDGTARVGGIGEKVEEVDLKYLEGASFILIMPQESISTEIVYQDLRRIPPETFEKDILLEQGIGGYAELINAIENDLQDITVRRSDLVREVVSKMSELKEFKTCMSGSGSSVFVFNRKEPKVTPSDMENVANQLRNLPLKIRETRYFRPECLLDKF